jgi:transcriptional regulator with XRE-family HTH domain
MKGRRPNRLNKIREQLLSDEATRSEYLNQRLISELSGIVERYLKEQNLTQSALARTLNIHQPDLNALLRGRAEHVPTLHTLRRLSQGLGVGFAIHIEPNGVMRIEREESAKEARDLLQQDYEAAR